MIGVWIGMSESNLAVWPSPTGACPSSPSYLSPTAPLVPSDSFTSYLSSSSLRHFFVNPETPGVHRAASIPQPRTVARVQRGSQHHTQHSFARPSPLLGFISSVLPIPPLLLCELGEARSPIEPCALSTLCLSIPNLPCPSPGRNCQAAPGLQYVLEMPHDYFPVGTLGM